MQIAPTCHKCGTLLVLIREGLPNYSWQCPNRCLPPVDTGVSASEPFDPVEGAESGNVEFNASLFWPPLSPNRERTAKVFMPHILHHFIECTRGGCCNALYSNVIVPHLDSTDVVDFVLHSSAIHPTKDVVTGKTGARIYAELRWRFNGVQSEKIRQYLSENFGAAECQTHVVDTVRLEKFRTKRKEWLSCLNGDDLHSIWRQQSSLLWDYALFLTINELRKEAAQNSTEGVGFNTPVLSLFDMGFAIAQVTGIRRLTEKQPTDPLKRVISLRALVDDVRKSRELLTREVYLGCHELPFDPAPAKQRHFDRIAASGQKLFCEGMDTKGPQAWTESESAHEQFDKLSETSAIVRSGNDLVSLKWFDLLDSKIKSNEDVCVFTNKFIAHAADPTSRAGLNDNQTKVPLSRLAECHQAMLQVAGFIGGPLLQDAMSAGLPVPQFNLLENLDKAWVGKEGMNKAQEHWQQHADQIEKWAAASLM